MKIRIILILIHFFDLLPVWLIKLLFFWRTIKYKNVCINPIKTNNLREKKDILIWMDYSNAIGDFFAILNSIRNYDLINTKYSLLINAKFKGIVEKLNLKNATIIYKENSLGTHYDSKKENITDKMNLIRNEFVEKKLCFKKIYYFNGILLCDAILAMKNIEYDELHMIDPRVFKRGKNSLFIDRNHIDLSFFFLFKNNMKIHIFKSQKNRKKTIKGFIENMLNFNNQEQKNVINNSPAKKNILITAGTSNATKVLKENKILEILRKTKNYESNTFVFVGSDHDKKFIPNILLEKTHNICYRFDLTLNELYELVLEACLIISYDTGVYHIAKFLNKQIILIINKEDFAYKYMNDYWLGRKEKNEVRIILDKNNFYK